MITSSIWNDIINRVMDKGDLPTEEESYPDLRDRLDALKLHQDDIQNNLKLVQRMEYRRRLPETVPHRPKQSIPREDYPFEWVYKMWKGE